MLIAVLILGLLLFVGVHLKTRWPWRKSLAFSLKAAFFLVCVSLIALWLFGVVLTLLENAGIVT